MPRPRTIINLVCSLSVLLLLSGSISAQKKFLHAVDRSDHAGRIIASLALLPDTGFPQELIKKSEAVAVFPTTKKESALFAQVTQGYGVISSRMERIFTGMTRRTMPTVPRCWKMLQRKRPRPGTL